MGINKYINKSLKPPRPPPQKKKIIPRSIPGPPHPRTPPTFRVELHVSIDFFWLDKQNPLQSHEWKMMKHWQYIALVAESAFLDVIHAGFERSPEISIFSPGIQSYKKVIESVCSFPGAPNVRLRGTTPLEVRVGEPGGNFFNLMEIFKYPPFVNVLPRCLAEKGGFPLPC